MKRFECFLSNEAFVKGLSIKRIDDNNYIIDIKECAFAREGIHKTLEMKGGSCPYALLVAAVLTSVENTDQYLKVGESKYTDEGSTTDLHIE
jgi:hypothetical protein